MAVAKRGQGHDVVVIGGGIAGLTAAWHATHYGLSAALIERSALFGGQVATVTTLDGYPGIGSTSGADLAAAILEAARQEGVLIIDAAAEAVATRDGRLQVAAGPRTVLGRAAIVATGARHRELDVPGARTLAGRGVSRCASCDGPLFNGQDVVVIGGGDAALQEAALLAPICRSVTLIVRNRLRARRKFVARVKAFRNVRFLWDCVVDAVLGDAAVAGVRLRNHEDGSISELPCAGVFPYIGMVPNTEFLPDALKRNAEGHLVTSDAFATSLPGIYAVGAVRSGYSGELSSAAGEGAAVIKDIASALASGTT
jgi:thioredoxin reductase (NADPH)